MEQYKLSGRPEVRKENVIAGKRYRISVLTERLIRLEYDEDGIFEDRMTQTVLNRDFPAVSFQVLDRPEELQIATPALRIYYDKKEFSPRGLKIQLMQESEYDEASWSYGQEIHDRGGTARTLDQVDGACPLEHGLMAGGEGFSVLDDSGSLILTAEGWIEPRRRGVKDLYFWGYGKDYLGCLKDFYYLCGKTPMLPRFALGNWWSRYYEYSEESYLKLMRRFDEEQIPFSVAVIDMDWHLVKIDPKYGRGWTGYTWNRELFPDPKRFMEALHRRGMKITLNVHPADGVRGHEEMYREMAEALGKDVEKEEPVTFDVTDPAFLRAYFRYLHHPQEEKGVDFWWIDWQQGSSSKVEGLDPLWMLNHFHFLDSARKGRRPLTFSRYAGPGSHRYPIGFSGDTVVTWESLHFQPYFTATASNIGYGWWSHDIGGHMQGYKDDELECRWYQFGVFSPINRLHSTKNEFNGKEPWRFGREVRSIMGEFLRLRHRLLPYLYTMNYRAWAKDVPLMLPMYYRHPDCQEAYQVPNEYEFGSELLVMPVTSRRLSGIGRAKEKVWLPEGTYIDVFTGVIYEGGRSMLMYRTLDSLPVLAKAGAIIPMQEEISAVHLEENPEILTLKCYGGADGSFTLYEDDNVSCDYERGICAKTRIDLVWNSERQGIHIHPASGRTELLPKKRTWRIEIFGCRKNSLTCFADGKQKEAAVCYEEELHCIRTQLTEIDPTEDVWIAFDHRASLAENETDNLIFRFLDQAEISFDLKTELYKVCTAEKDAAVTLSRLQAMDLNRDLENCLSEFLTAQSRGTD